MVIGMNRKVIPDFKLSELIWLLEKGADEWMKDADWWTGTHTWDAHVWLEGYNKDRDFYEVFIYGLEAYRDENGKEWLQMDDRDLDYFLIEKGE